MLTVARTCFKIENHEGIDSTPPIMCDLYAVKSHYALKLNALKIV